MSEWQEECLGKLATIEIGGTPPREITKYWARDEQDGHTWLSIADLGSRIVSHSKERITELGVRNSNVKRVPKGTLIMSFKLSIGRAGIAGTDLYTNEAIAAIVPANHRIDAEFLYHVLPPIAKNAITDNAVKGVTLNKQTLKSLLLRFPQSLNEQKRIAEILSTIDQTIAHTEALIQKYQQIKAGLMHDLFTRDITSDGQLRPPREQAPELYKDSAIGWIPKEWDCRILDSEVRIIDCKHYTPQYQTDGIPVIRPRNVNSDGLDFENVDYVSESDYYLLTDVHKPHIGDIVYSRNASFGVPCYVNSDRKFAIGQDVVVMTKTIMDTLFIFYVLKSHLVWQQITRLFAGSTFGRINLGDIRRFVIPKPTETEQLNIAKRLNDIDYKIGIEREIEAKLQKQKSGLMQDLLTGKVPVTISES